MIFNGANYDNFTDYDTYFFQFLRVLLSINIKLKKYQHYYFTWITPLRSSYNLLWDLPQRYIYCKCHIFKSYEL